MFVSDFSYSKIETDTGKEMAVTFTIGKGTAEEYKKVFFLNDDGIAQLMLYAKNKLELTPHGRVIDLITSCVGRRVLSDD